MYVKLLRYMYVRKHMIGHLNKPSINKINICANFFQSPMREYLVYHHSPLLVFSLINTNFIVVWDTWVTRFTLFVNLWQRSCKLMGKQICTLNKVKVPYRILWEQTEDINFTTLSTYRLLRVGWQYKMVKKGRGFIFDIWQLCELGIVSYDNTALNFA